MVECMGLLVVSYLIEMIQFCLNTYDLRRRPPWVGWWMGHSFDI